MKAQRLNPKSMNPMEMNNASNLMSQMSLVQKIGKGKRKYTVSLDKNDKKFLGKFLEEAKKQFAVGQGDQAKPLADFVDYMISICNDKEKKELRLSYEELEFLKRMLQDSVKGMENVKFKWYQIFNKLMVKTMLNQYKELLKKIN